MSDAGGERTIRSLTVSVFLPSFLFGVGQGAVIPIVALVAKDLGASVAVAGFVVAGRGLGTLVFDLPAGSLVSRYGERRAMSFATALMLFSLLGCVAADSVVLFAAFMFLMGCGWAVWLLARMAYVAEVMPDHLRGRALSTLGGVMRTGNVLGPFLAAAAIGLVGLDGPYYVHAVVAAISLGVLFLVPDAGRESEVRQAPVTFRAVGRAHRSVWLSAGVGALCIGVLRACRPVVLPLWAAHVGVDAAGVSMLFGISSVLEVLLFYPAGSVSDRLGRKAVALPCMGFMALGYLILPLTHSFSTLAVAALVVGFGNGLGSGIVMTLGTDFAPAVGRAEFLGVWRLVGDIGTSGGPVIAAGVSGVAGLAASSVTAAGLGMVGLAVVATRMPEPIHRLRRAADDEVEGAPAAPV